MKRIAPSLTRFRNSGPVGLAAALAGLLLLTGMALAAGPPAIDWWVIAGGGGHAETGLYTLNGTLGQPVVGVDTASSSVLCSGYWCGASAAAPDYLFYLPLVLRNFSEGSTP